MNNEPPENSCQNFIYIHIHIYNNLPFLYAKLLYASLAPSSSPPHSELIKSQLVYHSTVRGSTVAHVVATSSKERP